MAPGDVALATVVALGYLGVGWIVARRRRSHPGPVSTARLAAAGLLWPVTLALWNVGFALGLRERNGDPRT